MTTKTLTSAAFKAGVNRLQWRQLSYAYSILYIGVSAIESDGSSSEYSFRFDVSGFPGTAPQVTIWDLESNAALEPTKRPKGSARVVEAFKRWGNDTIYRPWDRQAGPHNNWSATYPALAWYPSRHLTFILEDLHGLLTSNALAQGSRIVS